MIIDSHEHILYPTELQLAKMDAAGVDKAVLFCTAPHPERAENLRELEAELGVLDRLLAGDRGEGGGIRRMKKNNAEVAEKVREYPDRFFGFGAVPLGLSLRETKDWIDTQITGNFLQGVGEFTPGSSRQVQMLDTVFQALGETKVCPVWVHTFHPVTHEGIRLLMGLCEKYRDIPVVFGHMGGSFWMEALKFAKEHGNVYLDLSAAFSSMAVRMALTELPERCLYSSDAPYGEPYLSRQMIEFVSPDQKTAGMALGENVKKLLKTAE